MVSPDTSPDHTKFDGADSRSSPPRAPAAPPAAAGVMPAHAVLARPALFLALLKSTWVEWTNDNVPRMSAALAYYTIFSLAPLLVIAIAVAGLVFGVQAAQGEISGQMQAFIGRESARTVEALIQSAQRPSDNAIATMVGIVVLLLGATGTFSEMQDALNIIWRARRDSNDTLWRFCKTRLWSFGMVLAIGFLLLVSLLLSTLLAALAKYAGTFLPVPSFVLHIGDVLLSFSSITVLFAMIFKLLPRAQVAWNDVWLGALLTSVLFTAGKFVIGFYIGESVSASAYGAAGSLVVVIAWIYYSALLLYFGAEFTRVYSNSLGSSRCRTSTPGGHSGEQ